MVAISWLVERGRYGVAGTETGSSRRLGWKWEMFDIVFVETRKAQLKRDGFHLVRHTDALYTQCFLALRQTLRI